MYYFFNPFVNKKSLSIFSMDDSEPNFHELQPLFSIFLCWLFYGGENVSSNEMLRKILKKPTPMRHTTIQEESI